MKFAYTLLITSVFLHCLGGRGYCISPPPDNAQITVVKGGGASFIFNTMDKFASGITLADWTVLRIIFVDDVPVQCSGWSFTVAAIQSEIKMSGGVPAIPLDCLKYTVTVDGIPIGGEYELSNAPTTVLSDANFGDPFNASHEVKITYKLGVPPDLVSSYPSGFYYVDLSFDLLVKP